MKDSRLGLLLCLSAVFSFILVQLPKTAAHVAMLKSPPPVRSPGAANNRTAVPQTVFTNSTAITINDAATATPYPSDISVSGAGMSLPATPDSIKVTLNGFSHTFPDDVGIVLQGPTGAALLLQDGAGDDPDIVNVTYTLCDCGGTQLPTTAVAWTAGTYRPASQYTGDSFPAPGPGTSYNTPGPVAGGTATFQSTFAGTNPNGVWHLYVVDFVGGDSGAISGGWSLEIAAAAPVSRPFGDFDGDGKTDIGVWRPSTGTWYINRSLAGFLAVNFGANGDKVATGDYDGDGKADVAVFRGDTTWYLLQSTAGLKVVNFGIAGDIPMPRDYDGDGKTDVAVYRPSSSAWYALRSSNNTLFSLSWGVTGDIAVKGDFDGDGLNDPTVFRPGNGTWYTYKSTGGTSAVSWGLATDKVAPADYDGDNKDDIAVFRNGDWYILKSTGGTGFVHWGASGDVLAPGDYDGDNLDDFAVYRSDTFYINRSTLGVASLQFGSIADYMICCW